MSQTKHALIFGIDGCRPDALRKAKTPYIDSLIANGSFSPNAQTGEITISGPGWSDMLTGVWWKKHGVRDNSFEGSNYDRYPHLFSRLKECRPDLITASIVNWAPINEQILRAADFAKETSSDSKVLDETLVYLRTADPNVLYLQLDDVDSAGHKHTFSPDAEGYLDSIEVTDSIIGAICQAVVERPNYANEDWLLIVSTDHGGTHHGHGENIPEHRTIFLVAHAPYSIEFPEEVNIVDIPVLVASHLGIEVDPQWEWDGKPY